MVGVASTPADDPSCTLCGGPVPAGHRRHTLDGVAHRSCAADGMARSKWSKPVIWEAPKKRK